MLNVFLLILIILKSALASPFLHVGAHRGRKRPKTSTEGSVCHSSPTMPIGGLGMQREVCMDSRNVSVSANPTALCAGVKPPFLLEVKELLFFKSKEGQWGAGGAMIPNASPTHPLSASAMWCYLSVKTGNKAQQHHSNPTRCALTVPCASCPWGEMGNWTPHHRRAD